MFRGRRRGLCWHCEAAWLLILVFVVKQRIKVGAFGFGVHVVQGLVVDRLYTERGAGF